MTVSTPLIAYIRVSTDKQGQSGLGLAAQKAAIDLYAVQSGGTVLRTFTEIESGKSSANRPQLAAALAHAKRARARLVIAKLDRLARNVHFISGLAAQKVDFVCCDNPNATPLTINILAAVAEDEARAIAARTRAALAAAKARGQLLGSARVGHWQGREHIRQAAAAKANAASVAAAKANNASVYAAALPIIKAMRTSGATFQQISDKLNADGLTTARGLDWNKAQVRRLVV